jgi:hypothetical protein
MRATLPRFVRRSKEDTPHLIVIQSMSADRFFGETERERLGAPTEASSILGIGWNEMGKMGDASVGAFGRRPPRRDFSPGKLTSRHTYLPASSTGVPHRISSSTKFPFD